MAIPLRVLGLDISTRTGYALIVQNEETQVPKLFASGLIVLGDRPVVSYGDGVYPWNYLEATGKQARLIAAAVRQYRPQVIVIEEVNMGRSRYAQKILEWIHCQLLAELRGAGTIVYYSSSVWRQALALTLTREQKRDNARLAKAKREAAAVGGRVDRRALGIRGRVTKKHVAVAYVNQRYQLALKVKDNDIADAICLATAYADTINGVSSAIPCDGIV